MTRTLFYSAALSVLLVSAAQAQPYDNSYSRAKGEANVLNDAQRMEAEEPAQRQTMNTAPAQPQNTEPASGDMREEGTFADFTGPYVGGDVGYTIGSYGATDPAGPDGDVGIDGMTGGVFAGYGFEHNFSWLGGYAGVELGYEWSGADGDMAGNSYEKNNEWLVTFRPGLTMHQDAMAYGIIGYSRAEFEVNDDEEELNGLVLGAGAEFDTNTAFKTRLEYTYTNYEDKDISGIDFDGHDNTIKLGALFRF